jgi:hypothetical protein
VDVGILTAPKASYNEDPHGMRANGNLNAYANSRRATGGPAWLDSSVSAVNTDGTHIMTTLSDGVKSLPGILSGIGLAIGSLRPTFGSQPTAGFAY